MLFLNVKRVLTMCPSACARHSRIIRNLLGELAEKNLRFGEKLTHMGQRTTRAKIMSYLSAEAQRLGTCEFDIPFSRQQLADYLGVERSGLSLELGRMKRTASSSIARATSSCGYDGEARTYGAGEKIIAALLAFLTGPSYYFQ